MTPTRDSLTVAQAAEVLGVTPDRVRKLIVSGRLVATRFGARVYQIEPAALEAVRNRTVGRPRTAGQSGKEQ
jgi:excisionase family DNA binding protein